MSKEVKKALEYCINADSCVGCKFIDYETCRDELIKIATQCISDQEKEIERLQKKLADVLVLIQDTSGKIDLKKLQKQAVKAFAEKLKDYLMLKMTEEYGDMTDSTQYYTIDVDEFTYYIDGLVEECN